MDAEGLRMEQTAVFLGVLTGLCGERDGRVYLDTLSRLVS